MLTPAVCFHITHSLPTDCNGGIMVTDADLCFLNPFEMFSGILYCSHTDSEMVFPQFCFVYLDRPMA